MKNTLLISILITISFISCNKVDQIILTPFTDGEKWGFIDSEKNIVLNTIYDDAFPFSEGLAAIKKDDKWGYINLKGEEVIIPLKYDFAGSFHNGYAIVRQYGKWGYIDMKGNEIIPPEKYDFVGEFSEGLAIVCLRDKYGFMNKDGQVVVEPKYDLVWDFTSGKAKVFQNKRFGYIDKKGEEIVPVKYDLIFDFKNNIALAKQNTRWSFINSNGNEVKELNYEYIWDCDNLGYYKVFKNDKYGFIDNKGEEIILPKYDYTEDFKNNVSIVKKNNSYGIIDRYGKEIIPLVYQNIDFLNQVALKTNSEINGEEYLNQYGQINLNYSMSENNIPNPPEEELKEGKFIDERTNREYGWKKIGTQVWMTENLKFKTEDSKCFTFKKIEDCDKYGVYYTWEALIQSNVCPEGWRVPTDQDWKKLIEFCGGDKEAYSKLIEGGSEGLQLKLGGYYFNGKTLDNEDNYGYYWTISEDDNKNGICYWVNKDEQSILQFPSKKNHMRSVICIKE